MTSHRSDFVLAPALFGAYGLIRILDGLDGERGPGLAWTAGHLCFVVGLFFFVRGFVAMRALAGPRDRWATAGLVAAVAGSFALTVQFGVDIVTGLMADSHAEMGRLSDNFGSLPGAELAFYAVGPMFFFVGQVILGLRLFALRKLPVWSPCLLFTASLLPLTTKDLIPLGAVLLLAGYAPLWRPSASRTALTSA
ncbi:hypothetical protein GTY65_34920 [Streptomyces sp. SID8379]|uniref:hypothetical protein n=1 Tax=unclassified Streptomyces TaxID=2593676 RepID=UPI0003648DEC|nr:MULTISPECIES: hypothetical protein [unclassified Streptomyces]MYW69225.1 hypothetical protein [Streptomyces sp. SID8379]